MLVKFDEFSSRVALHAVPLRLGLLMLSAHIALSTPSLLFAAGLEIAATSTIDSLHLLVTILLGLGHVQVDAVFRVDLLDLLLARLLLAHPASLLRLHATDTASLAPSIPILVIRLIFVVLRYEFERRYLLLTCCANSAVFVEPCLPAVSGSLISDFWGLISVLVSMRSFLRYVDINR